jgi:NAD(P)-dependent dehydrogenase (short-subunit alcohol dehydrogenase family)
MITGAANGIGRATALEFARRGARVVVTDIDLDAARDVAQQIGGAACAFHLDVTSEDSISAAFDEATAAVGPITVVHANAGVSSMKPATELTQADWDFNMNINAKGVYLTNVAAIRQFRKNNVKGVIVNTASLAAKVGAPPLGRLETPEDVAGVVIFLASDDARFMTGQAINVTGGVYMT